MAAPSALALSEAERAELLRSPQAFASRCESVLSSLLAKLNRLEAERGAERTDSERMYHKLERAQATMREEHAAATAQCAKMQGEHGAILTARDAHAAEAARLGGELRAARAEAERAKESEREGGVERSRLLQVIERKVR